MTIEYKIFCWQLIDDICTSFINKNNLIRKFCKNNIQYDIFKKFDKELVYDDNFIRHNYIQFNIKQDNNFKDFSYINTDELIKGVSSIISDNINREIEIMKEFITSNTEDIKTEDIQLKFFKVPILFGNTLCTRYYEKSNFIINYIPAMSIFKSFPCLKISYYYLVKIKNSHNYFDKEIDFKTFTEMWLEHRKKYL